MRQAVSPEQFGDKVTDGLDDSQGPLFDDIEEIADMISMKVDETGSLVVQ